MQESQFVTGIADDDICYKCGSSLCEFTQYHEFLEKLGKDAKKKHNGFNKKIQFHLYKGYIAARYGKLGRYNCTPPPSCVKNGIKKLYPEPSGEYVGYKLERGGGDDDDDIQLEDDKEFLSSDTSE